MVMTYIIIAYIIGIFLIAFYAMYEFGEIEPTALILWPVYILVFTIVKFIKIIKIIKKGKRNANS